MRTGACLRLIAKKAARNRVCTRSKKRRMQRPYWYQVVSQNTVRDTVMTLSVLAAIALIAYLARGALAAGTRLEQISQERQQNAAARQVH